MWVDDKPVDGWIYVMYLNSRLKRTFKCMILSDEEVYDHRKCKIHEFHVLISCT